MRKANRTGNWGLLLALLVSLLFPLAASRAEGTADNGGLTMSITNRPFTEIVQTLARENGMNLVIVDPVDAVISKVDFTNTPAKDIIASLAKPLGLVFWQDGDTYYLSKHRPTSTAPADQPTVIDPAPAAAQPGITATPAAVIDNPDTLPTLKVPTGNPSTFSDTNDDTPSPAPEQTHIRRIELQYFPVVDLLWALGKPGATLGSRQAEKRVTDRIQTVLSHDKSFDINATDPTNSSSSGSSAPWLNSAVSGSINRDSATDSNQIRNPRSPYGGSSYGGSSYGRTPYGTGNGTGVRPGTTVAGANGTTQQTDSNLTTAELTPFIPKGVKDIVGLVGLNAILVRADTEDDIDQLEMLIKLLDQPVKQVIVECMIVKMSVEDAMAMGVSWSYAGMPISVISNNGGDQGNFAVSYVKGSVKVALATALSSSTTKVVQNPRVIVPNGGGGGITIDDEVPFITVDSQTDVFGRTISNPTINTQQFSQGLIVNSVLIHPDDTITLDVSPIIDIPSAGVPIPGGAGDVMGSTSFDMESLVTVKNGETVLLGGFTTKTEVQSGSRAPLLGDMPVIGPLLFRNKSHGVTNDETLVFVTATIMKEDTPIFGEMAPLPPLF